jgi:type IV secretion system protein TrbE
MLNLSEFRGRACRLADWIPWACLVAPGIVLNKDGSFQRTVRYRGPDLDSATETELVSVASRVNNVLKRFGSGWALFFDAERTTSASYPQSLFPDAVSWLVDEERRSSFENGEGGLSAEDQPPENCDHYESIYHMTLIYLPPTERMSRLATIFLNDVHDPWTPKRLLGRVLGLRGGDNRTRKLGNLTDYVSETPASAAKSCGNPKMAHGANSGREAEQRSMEKTKGGGEKVLTGSPRVYRDCLDNFVRETNRAIDLLTSVMPEVRPLNDEETLTYLHSCVSTKRHSVRVPDVPAYLDAFLCDESFVGGLSPALGRKNLRTVTVLGFPTVTFPGILDDLNLLGVEYRWVTRFISLDRTQADSVLKRYRRHWFAKRKSIGTILKEVMLDEQATLVDTDADNKASDADVALQELGDDLVSFGYITTTVCVWDEEHHMADEKIRAVEKVINARGFTTIRETMNAVEAWLGSLPGQTYANVRQPIVHTLNLAHMCPLSAVWAGPERCSHLNGPPLMFAKTKGATPFRLSLHVGDVGHTLIVGPTGAGKSVLLSILALQFRRYPGSRIVIFDKGRSARAATLAMGGRWYELGVSGGLAFQPLRHIDDSGTRLWALDWLCGVLVHERVAISPDVKDSVWSALRSLSSAPQRERTMTGLVALLAKDELRQALEPYTLEGPYGRFLDADQDNLSDSDVITFEMDELMNVSSIVVPVLTYMFHALESRFAGQPTLLVIDEAWVFLDDPLFSQRIREWLKTLRKLNVSVVFATQSLADIAASKIAPVISESCPTRIFLPNSRATEPTQCEIYSRFGLNESQIRLISEAFPKRDYYLQSRVGNRMFELGLGPIALALVASSTPEDQRLINVSMAESGLERFAEQFLIKRGLPWAADLLLGFEHIRKGGVLNKNEYVSAITRRG